MRCWRVAPTTLQRYYDRGANYSVMMCALRWCRTGLAIVLWLRQILKVPPLAACHCQLLLPHAYFFLLASSASVPFSPMPSVTPIPSRRELLTCLMQCGDWCHLIPVTLIGPMLKVI